MQLFHNNLFIIALLLKWETVEAEATVVKDVITEEMMDVIDAMMDVIDATMDVTDATAVVMHLPETAVVMDLPEAVKPLLPCLFATCPTE